MGDLSAASSTSQQVSTPQAEKRGSKQESAQQNPGEDSTMMDVLENTLWNRQLGIMSEEIVAALVCQIFEGVRHRTMGSACLNAGPLLHGSLRPCTVLRLLTT